MRFSKLKVRHPQLTRERLVDPQQAPFRDRLRDARAIDLVNNHRIVRLNDGYDRVVANDATRLVK
jgi:hypothetical protein